MPQELNIRHSKFQCQSRTCKPTYCKDKALPPNLLIFERRAKDCRIGLVSCWPCRQAIQLTRIEREWGFPLGDATVPGAEKKGESSVTCEFWFLIKLPWFHALKHIYDTVMNAKPYGNGFLFIFTKDLPEFWFSHTTVKIGSESKRHRAPPPVNSIARYRFQTSVERVWVGVIPSYSKQVRVHTFSS